MQPYLFPYLGYFQLISAVDKFVFYDDVNFIKRGWINRNQILVNGKSHLFSIPLQRASQNKLINEVLVLKDQKWKVQFFKTLKQHYHNAPFFKETSSLVEHILNDNYTTIADLAIHSVTSVSDYLGLDVTFELASKDYFETKGLGKTDRLIAITNSSDCTQYINPSGGKELYEKSYFSEKGIELLFIENHLEPYTQFNTPSVTGLSIIDVLMFNAIPEIIKMIEKFKLN